MTTHSQNLAGAAGAAGGRSSYNAIVENRNDPPAEAGTSTRSTRSTRSQPDPARWLAGLLDATGAARVGGKWQCPAHGRSGEHSVSVAVGLREDGAGAWLHCHAGCDLRTLLAALRISRNDLRSPPPVAPARHAAAFRLVHQFPPPRAGAHGSLSERGYVLEAEHPYGDPTTVAWKERHRQRSSGAKEIRWESLNPKGERVPGLLGRREVDLPLYRIADVRMGLAALETVVLVESESSVDALERAGVYATTWCGGAGSPPLDRLAADLGSYGGQVLIVPDADDAGMACVERLVAALPDARVQLGQPGEDARDVLARCGPGWFR